MNQSIVQGIIAKVEEYLAVPAVIRFEQVFLRYLAADFKKLGCAVNLSKHLLIIHKPTAKNKRVLLIHCDRNGLIINEQGHIEYADFHARKHYSEPINFSKHLIEYCADNFLNEPVYAYTKTGKTLATGIVTAARYHARKQQLLFKIAGFKKLPIHTPIAYKPQLLQLNTRIAGQLDNVISVAVAYQLAKQGLNVHIVFSTEEEIGRSWRHTMPYLSALAHTQELITLDTTPYNHTHAINAGLVILRNRDEHYHFNNKLVNELETLCRQQHIPFAYKDKQPKHKITKTIGKTELGRIARATQGVCNGATIQLPTCYYHTNHETTSPLALYNYYTLIAKCLK
ncbi:MAG: hypothetical protein WC801_01420 [Patescibacteria group bacterium]|jgi:putative aminopeptidase FrvX